MVLGVMLAWMIGRELQRKGLGLWRGDELRSDSTAMDVDRGDGEEDKAEWDLYIDAQCGGLFPAVLPASDKQHTSSQDAEHTKDGDEPKSKATRHFRFLGRYVPMMLLACPSDFSGFRLDVLLVSSLLDSIVC